MKHKVLNLYAGIGGNRKLWENVDVTAVEIFEDIATIYNYYYPNDNVIVGDALKYLIDNYKHFDFIWASPVCRTHSRIRYASAKSGSYLPKVPDLSLYELIIFLNKYFDGYFVVENVKPYYDPLIEPSKKIGRHYFWCNFEIKNFEYNDRFSNSIVGGDKLYGYDLSGFETSFRKDQILRDMINPKLGNHIFNCYVNAVGR